jgi:hypothetical protein
MISPQRERRKTRGVQRNKFFEKQVKAVAAAHIIQMFCTPYTSCQRKDLVDDSLAAAARAANSQYNASFK